VATTIALQVFVGDVVVVAVVPVAAVVVVVLVTAVLVVQQNPTSSGVSCTSAALHASRTFTEPPSIPSRFGLVQSIAADDAMKLENTTRTTNHARIPRPTFGSCSIPSAEGPSTGMDARSEAC
jgi:hypothetical protein